MRILVFCFALFMSSSLSAKADSLIQKSLDAGKLTYTYQEWESSPFHPDKVINEILESPDSCQELSSLENKDLSHFYAALTTAEKNTECVTKLILRIEQYIADEQLNLSLRSKSMAKIFSPLAHTGGDTRVQVVDTTGGPRFINKLLLNPMEVALTLDDGPHPVLTGKLLNILAQHNVKATYFVVGNRVEQNPSVLLDVEAAGHTIGTHSYSHPSSTLRPLNDQDAFAEFNGGFMSALDYLDQVAPFFRFPYGARNHFLTNYMSENDISDFFWDVDPRDWDNNHSVESLYDYALEQVERTKGGILLFHDVQARTIAVMPALIAELRARGYSFVVYEPKEWLTK